MTEEKPEPSVEEAKDVTAELVTTPENGLTPEEEELRKELETQVVEAFSRAGLALKRLRDEKLYRSTHKNFNDYAQEILGFTRIRLYQLIGAAEVYENLKENVNAPLTFLPSSEYQCRPLVKLEPVKQVQAWKEALETAAEKPPTSHANVPQTAKYRTKSLKSRRE